MLGLSLRTADIRELFKALLTEKKFTTINREASMTSLVGNTTIEIIGASFIADEDSIFGDVNWDYVHREEEWYNSMSLNVNDIPGGAPKIWASVASTKGLINSNYGNLLYSKDNYFQFENVLNELKNNPASRRAIAIYTRPQIWNEYNTDGMSDFICTNSVQYLIRNGDLQCVVNMRSNDAWAGYRNDLQWQKHVQSKLASALGVGLGTITWQVGSLHVYASQYYLVDHFARTGEINISKNEYVSRNPESSFR